MAFNIALSGLNATAEAIDVTSNNIANSQTVGYKAGQYVFADQFFRAQDPQSKDRSGMGTYRMAIRRDQNYGTITGTQNPLDLALTGPGMFVLAKTATGNVPNETPNVFQYTRNGQFAVDSQNRIVNENGMLLVGYPADTQGNISQGGFSVLTMDQSPLPAKASSASTINVNLNNTGNPISTAFDPNQTVTYTQSTSQTVYDSAGNQHTLSQYYAKTDPATLYFYPQDASGTNFSFNPTQDVSPLAQNFGVGQNVAGIPSGVAQDANFSIATTASPPTGSTPASVEYLSGASIVPFPANQSSTYQMTLNDGSKMLVTKQSFTDNTTDPANPKTYTRFAFSADRYKIYSTVDGINVNRVIDTQSQVGANFSPVGVITLSQNKVVGKNAGTILASETGFVEGVNAGTIAASENGFVNGANATSATDTVGFGANLNNGQAITVNGLTYTNTTGSAITAANIAVLFSTSAIGTNSGANANGYTGTWNAAYSQTTTNTGGVLGLTAAVAGGSKAAAILVSTNGPSLPTGAFVQGGTVVGTTVGAEAAFSQGANATFAADTVAFSADLGNGDSITVNGLTYTNTTGAAIPAASIAAQFSTSAIGTNSGTNTNGYTGTWNTAYSQTTTNIAGVLGLTAAVAGGSKIAASVVAAPVVATAATDSISFTANLGNGDAITVNGLTYTNTTGSAITAANIAALFSTSAIGTNSGTNANGYSGTWNAAYSQTTTNPMATTLGITAAITGSGKVGLTKAADTVAFSADLGNRDSITVNGLTYTNTTGSTISAANIAVLFSTANIGTYSGHPGSGYSGTWGAAYSQTTINTGGVLGLAAAAAGAGKSAVAVSSTQALSYATDAITFAADLPDTKTITVNGLTYTNTTGGAIPAASIAAYFSTSAIGTNSGTNANGYTGTWNTAYSQTTTNTAGVLGLTAAVAGGSKTAAGLASSNAPTVATPGSFVQGGTVMGTISASEAGFVNGTSVALAATPQVIASATDTVTFSQMAPGDSVTIAGLTFTNNTANTITANQAASKFTATNITANSNTNANDYTGIFDLTNFSADSATSGIGNANIVFSSMAQGASAQNLSAGSVIAHQMHSNQTVTSVSVGGAIAGSAPAGTYTLGNVVITNGVSGAATASVLPTGGIPGVYTVNLSGGTGTGAQAIVNYSGSGKITGITLNGGQNYAAGNILNIPAGSLGSGSTAFSLAALTSQQVITGTYMTLSSGVGPALRSNQLIQDGVVQQHQNFDFANGVSMEINNSGSVVDSISTIANSFNNKTITVSNQPSGIMGFVAGKNIDSLSRDQFGKPAYNTRTTISTSVGSGTLKNMLSINIDSTNMTAYSSAAQTYDNSTDGNPMAQLTAYSIDNAGKLVANYDNGITVVKGQLAIANFNNTEGLIPIGANSYERSGADGMGSGPVIYGTANTGNLGAIRAKSVESSNVDLTAELVKLMTLQRLYSANSQAVKIEAATIVDDAIRLGQ